MSQALLSSGNQQNNSNQLVSASGTSNYNLTADDVYNTLLSTTSDVYRKCTEPLILKALKNLSKHELENVYNRAKSADVYNNFDDQIIAAILQYLNVPDLLSARCVNKHYNRVGQMPHVWQYATLEIKGASKHKLHNLELVKMLQPVLHNVYITERYTADTFETKFCSALVKCRNINSLTLLTEHLTPLRNDALMSVLQRLTIVPKQHFVIDLGARGFCNGELSWSMLTEFHCIDTVITSDIMTKVFAKTPNLTHLSFTPTSVECLTRITRLTKLLVGLRSVHGKPGALTCLSNALRHMQSLTELEVSCSYNSKWDFLRYHSVPLDTLTDTCCLEGISNLPVLRKLAIRGLHNHIIPAIKDEFRLIRMSHLQSLTLEVQIDSTALRNVLCNMQSLEELQLSEHIDEINDNDILSMLKQIKSVRIYLKNDRLMTCLEQVDAQYAIRCLWLRCGAYKLKDIEHLTTFLQELNITAGKLRGENADPHRRFDAHFDRSKEVTANSSSSSFSEKKRQNASWSQKYVTRNYRVGYT